MWHRSIACWLAGIAFLAAASPILSATRVQILEVNLASKIEVAARKRERFAVDVPHAATLRDSGEWQRAGGVSTWRYSVRIPTAVSMSFHAAAFQLPATATLEVAGSDGAVRTYRDGDGLRGALWSRLARGDTLNFVLRVPTALEEQARFSLKSLQAGYRGLGGGVPNHPYFNKLQAASNSVFAACSENFACHATPENSHNADATAALVIGGVALCTGTLINNTRSDGTFYLITARHCQDQPFAGITVYWDAVKPCGSALGSVYDIDAPAYSHSVDTVFEQQDVWMLRLGSPVNAQRVYFVGWDVTGGTFVGGYSPHHALGRSRQYTRWYGQAIPQMLPAATLGVGFDSNFWGVVNDLGNVGSGASGGGLFNPDHRIVGIASLAYIGESGEGVCPTTPVQAPTSSSVTALYSSLAAVWESNADTTSFTNPVTLKSLLDPDNSGVRVMNGFEALTNVWINVDQSTLSTGSPATLTWNGGAATSCTATGGVAGDGWQGVLPASGTRTLTQYEPGDTTYTVRCTDGTRFAQSHTRVTWYQLPPQGWVSVDDSSPYLGGSVHLVWRSNVAPCTATGGGTGDGWAGTKSSSGQQNVNLTQAGPVIYTLNCGTGARQFTSSATVDVRAPVATLTALSNNMRVGSEVIIMQTAAGLSCARSGGVPGTDWTTLTDSYPYRVTSSTAGTFRFTLTCEGGPTPAVATLDLTFTDDPPHAVLTASKPTAYAVNTGPVQDIIGTSPFQIEFNWVANVAPCQLSYDGPGDHDGNVNPQMDFPGAYSLSSIQEFPGIYEYRVTCQHGGETATATTSVEFLPAPATVLVTGPEAATVAANEQLYLGWYSNAAPCTATGGATGDGWAGAQESAGSKFVTLTLPGTYVYTMTCGTAPGLVTDSFTIELEPPAVTFLPHAAQVREGVGIALSWHSTVGPCRQTDEWANDFSYPANGANVALGAAGVHTYGIRCGTTSIVEASTQVTYLPRPAVDITASASSVSVNQPVTLSWTSSNADTCAVQGSGSQDWEGPLPTTGSRVITRDVPGTAGFYINCGGEIDAVVVEWRSVIASPTRPSPPTVSMSIDHTTRVAGEAVSISWTTTRAAACRGFQGVQGDDWNNALPVSGTRSIIVNQAGTYTWEIRCDGAPPSASAVVSATYTAAASGGSSGGGSSSSGGSSNAGGGGGGRVDTLLLAMLGFMVMVALARMRWARP